MSQSTPPRNGSRYWRKWLIVSSLFVIVTAFYGVQHVQGQQQTFSSGSNGTDLALNYPTAGTYYFDPTKFTPPLDPAGDNIFNFTTINIASGVTLKLSSKILSGPIYWLASGDVLINGVIDLSGDDGVTILSSTQSSLRLPAAPGAGGYSGGLGGMTGGSPAQAGNGAGGGAGATTTTSRGGDGTFTGNQFLEPLFGGSGGGGGLATANSFGGGGGAGGGGLLIASSTTITVNGSGQINVDGGNFGGNCGGGQCGGAGAGGAIHLVANTITNNCGNCTVLYSRGARGGAPASNGLIRQEYFSGPGVGSNPPSQIATPGSVLLPTTPPPSIKVTSINGVMINANPFSFPDTSFNSASAVVVNIQASYIPVGTIPKVIVFSEGAPDQTITASALMGTLALSTATASIPFPSGGSRGYVKATW